MVERKSSRDGSPLGDRKMTRTVVAHQNELVVEVEGVELGVGAAAAEPVEQEHADVRLQVALAGGGHPPRRQEREADDQTGRDTLGDAARRAAVVVGEPVELEVLDEAVEPGCDTCGPLEDLGRDLARDRVDACVGEIERLPNLLALALDRRGVGRLDSLDELVDLQQFDVHTGLRVYLREVGVQIEHPWIRVAEEADARVAHTAHRVACVQPFAQRLPCRVAVERRPRHRSVWDTRACECPRDLRNAAR